MTRGRLLPLNCSVESPWGTQALALPPGSHRGGGQIAESVQTRPCHTDTAQHPCQTFLLPQQTGTGPPKDPEINRVRSRVRRAAFAGDREVTPLPSLRQVRATQSFTRTRPRRFPSAGGAFYLWKGDFPFG